MRGVDLNVGRAEADKLGNFLAQNRDNVIQEIIERPKEKTHGND